MSTAEYTLYFVLPVLVLAHVILFATVFPRVEGDAGEKPWGLDRAVARMSHNLPGLAMLVISWLVITALAWWIEFLIGFGALYLVLFVAGRWAAVLAAMLLGIVFLITPLVVGKVMLGMTRSGATPGHTARVSAVWTGPGREGKAGAR